MLNINTKIAIRLNQELSCEYICKNIENLINRYKKQQIDLSNYLLVFELKASKDTGQMLLPRIGVKQ